MDYRAEILKMFEKIENEWILKQIYRFIKNITKED